MQMCWGFFFYHHLKNTICCNS